MVSNIQLTVANVLAENDPPVGSPVLVVLEELSGVLKTI
jgi:hypothetical protein